MGSQAFLLLSSLYSRQLPFSQMNIEPQPLEQQLRIESLKRRLKELSHEELLEYTERLLVISTKLTHQAKQMIRYIAETELGLEHEQST